MPVLSIKQLLSISILLLALLSPARAADPDVLNMVFVPASEKGDESDYESLIKIISDQAKIEIKTIKVIDYNAAVEAMRAGRAHIAWYGGKTYIKVEIANAQALLLVLGKVMITPDTTHILVEVTARLRR